MENKHKYIKYKNKYLNLKMKGGNFNDIPLDVISDQILLKGIIINGVRDEDPTFIDHINNICTTNTTYNAICDDNVFWNYVNKQIEESSYKDSVNNILLDSVNNKQFKNALFLIDKLNADINVKNTDSKSMLYIASLTGDIEMVKFLLDNKADPNTSNIEGSTAIFIATTYGHTEIVELLLSSGGNPSIVGKHKFSAYSIAKERNHTDIVALFDNLKIS